VLSENKKSVLSIGTNMGNRAKNILDAVEAISLLPDTNVLKCSRLYETKPIGYKNQQNFYNNCILIETKLSPLSLLKECLDIEKAAGRVSLFENGPRVLDIDLIVYEGFTSDTAELTLPHPRAQERAFVLAPMSELFDGDSAMGLSFVYDEALVKAL